MQDLLTLQATAGAAGQEALQHADRWLDTQGVTLLELLVTVWGLGGAAPLLIVEGSDDPDTGWVTIASYGLGLGVPTVPGPQTQTPILLTRAPVGSSILNSNRLKRYIRWRWSALTGGAGEFITFRIQVVAI